VRTQVRRCRTLATVALGAVLVTAVHSAVHGIEREPPLPNLSGRWVTVQTFVARADFPFLGVVSLATTVGLFSEVAQNGVQLTLDDAYCFSDVEVSTELFVTHIPDTAMQSIEPEPREMEIRIVEDRIEVVQDWVSEVRGAVLDDPVNDPLPTYRSDPRVIDMDGDGHPGFTIPAGIAGMFEGDTYVVQRFRYRLEGTLVDPDTIVGRIEWTTEQNVLWATDALLMLPYGQGIDPDPMAHRFLMRRVDEAWTCDAIRERVAPLLEALDVADVPEMM